MGDGRWAMGDGRWAIDNNSISHSIAHGPSPMAHSSWLSEHCSDVIGNWHRPGQFVVVHHLHRRRGRDNPSSIVHHFVRVGEARAAHPREEDANLELVSKASGNLVIHFRAGETTYRRV